jgi:hypothetical protein
MINFVDKRDRCIDHPSTLEGPDYFMDNTFIARTPLTMQTSRLAMGVFWLEGL